MPEIRIRVYSGTTLENFRTCTTRREDGQFEFNKSREPRYRSAAQFRYVDDLWRAYIFAAHLAYELNQIPVVMSGLLEERYKSFTKFPEGKPFCVDGVWIPRLHIGKLPYISVATSDIMIKLLPELVLEK